MWKLTSKTDFKEVGQNIFLLEFFETLNLQKVQEGCPWSFNRNLFCIQAYDASLTPSKIQFIREPMWVQLHNIHFGMMNRVFGEILGNKIGEIINIDVDNDKVGWGPFLQI